MASGVKVVRIRVSFSWQHLIPLISRTAFTIIWISVIYVIWKDRNNRVFHNKADQIETLAEKAKLQTFWWLKSYYILFDFDYPFWRLNPLSCLKADV
ncbi:hypothetical protein QL285_081684 [Trifolium repens]|nr:hypothetical protein QL285_081684 [Trifolium repens]